MIFNHGDDYERENEGLEIDIEITLEDLWDEAMHEKLAEDRILEENIEPHPETYEIPIEEQETNQELMTEMWRDYLNRTP